ncbi:MULTISPECIES: GlxA family transcriptional regulator [unclassified Mesorhizobium]|uniref:GlxA family transcriptional regulator n=1 Tax=unclassified Mesorhizobium TaxID=325217 RepID=UPI00333567E5
MNVHSHLAIVDAGVLAADSVGQQEPLSLAILILPGFSHLALGAYIEPLRVANSLAGREVFCWRVISLDGKSVPSSIGLQVAAAADAADFVTDGQRYDHVVIVAGHSLDPRKLPQVNHFLRNIARRNVKITAMGAATWLLAQAGLLADTRCTIHWSRLAAFSETFKESNVCNALFVTDGQFSTCAGELAAFDLALDLVARHTNASICREVCRYATAVSRRSGCDRQTSPAGLAFAGRSRKLAAALHLMEDNVEHPLNLTKLAMLCKISRRQLERLFLEQVGTSPSRHYRRIRLEHARRLIDGTNLSLTEVAIACGFQSPSHFSKCFRAMHGAAPSDCR